jgi:hypothetical protein
MGLHSRNTTQANSVRGTSKLVTNVGIRSREPPHKTTWRCLQQRIMKTEDFWTKWGNATGVGALVTPYPCTIELSFAPTIFGHWRRNVVMRQGSESQVLQCGCENWALISCGLEDGDILNSCSTWSWEVSFRLQPVHLWEGSSCKKRIEGKLGLGAHRLDVAVSRKTCSFAGNETLVFHPGT